jgi:hypothetical protein
MPSEIKDYRPYMPDGRLTALDDSLLLVLHTGSRQVFASLPLTRADLAGSLENLKTKAAEALDFCVEALEEDPDRWWRPKPLAFSGASPQFPVPSPQ